MIRDRVLSAPGLALISMAAGGLAFAGGLSFPVYRDTALALRIKAQACLGDRLVNRGVLPKLEALETWRHPLMQGGAAAVLCGLLVYGLWLLFPDPRRRWLATPSRMAPFFMSGAVALGMIWVGAIYSEMLVETRLPWCVGALGPVLIGATMLMLILAIVGAMLILAASRAFGALPVDLAVWDRAYPLRSAMASVIALLIAVGLAIVFMDSFARASFACCPGVLVLIYLVAAARAAALDPALAPGLVRSEF